MNIRFFVFLMLLFFFLGSCNVEKPCPAYSEAVINTAR